MRACRGEVCQTAVASAQPSQPQARAEVDRSQESAARALVEQAEARGLLRAFGRGRQLPKQLYTIEELRLNKVEPEKLLAPNDETLARVRNITQAAAAAGLAALAWTSFDEWGGFDVTRVVAALAGVTFTLVADQVANGGGGEALVVDTLGRLLDPKYGKRVALHEAGHLLIAYLLGVMPKAYTLSSLDAFMRYRALNIQAGTTFCDTAFEAEVSSGRLSGGTLDKYTCVALAGVVTEYLRFGQAEGGVGDVAQLDQLMRALGFTQKKADGQVRWAVLNVASILRRHAALHDALAAAMGSGESVGSCVALIEAALEGDAGAVLGAGEAEAGAAAFIGSSSAGTSAEASRQEP
ncbi:MAG: hypothetical protein J3K34DRAFT_4351 [Monoraphidium minutum]|nr:MAG: hypothetical protein J3K34DRAFT_4351 [Monoraphidium minutum]